MRTRKKIWIDLDNSPHVPFFRPIIKELERKGYGVVVTARDCFQVCGLADLLKVPYRRIGRHYGKNKLIKVLGLAVRAIQLGPTAIREKPHLALSHGSRSQLLVANMLGIPSALIFDYEHAKRLPFVHPDAVIVPEVIPEHSLRKHSYVGKYPGIKEDVYVPDFTPTAGILQQLGIKSGEIAVTVRPPATEAHYHRHQTDELFEAVMEQVTARDEVRMVLLPRNERQGAEIREKWPELFRSGKVLIPELVVDGLNLIWHSDVVISGGGTMNREAAALGVPVYSIFRGETGTVDRYLADKGRLTLLQSVQDVQTKLILEKWNRPPKPVKGSRPALGRIVDQLVAILENRT
ncbi:DUF354 domain-containing protein [Geotalea sp. SG265]|uniref:DUF354 domain-containing protein n=1 Tax=Geotalea sp. SG265 TaxID=2922867 RepID=UPI001FAFC51F|nr:DUF354 domain-containing protein [Geotalea sp. SG265]